MAADEGRPFAELTDPDIAAAADAFRAANLSDWPTEEECPECPHTDLDHDETGCTVPGCGCTGP